MSCSAVLDTPDGGGLMEMMLMLTSNRYRDSVVPWIKDPIVKYYWENVFPALAGEAKFAVQNLNAPLNKLRRFIANGIVANIICQKKSTIDIAKVMNSGGVILARFSRGDMGFENSALLGSMLLSKVQIAAMQRVKIPQDQRVPTYLYVDELIVAPLHSNVYRTTPLIQGNSHLETILSQAYYLSRKVQRLGLYHRNQAFGFRNGEQPIQLVI